MPLAAAVVVAATCAPTLAQRTPSWSPATAVPGSIYAWEEWNSAVYAAGGFTIIEGIEANRVARRDGTSWAPLGRGVYGAVNGHSPIVWALREYGQELIAGGLFASAGTVPGGNIARWDGSEWHALGGGVSGGAGGGGVRALAEFRGDLYAGGGFQRAGEVPAAFIARWDGSAWHGMQSGMDGAVTELAVHDNSLVVVGGFWNAAGYWFVFGVIRWTGTSWQLMQGLCGECFAGPLLVLDDRLYLGFTSIFGNHLVRWAGTEWIEVPNPGWSIRSLIEYRGEMIAGAGSFGYGVSRWTGSAWVPLGGGIANSQIVAMGVSADTLFASGIIHGPPNVPFWSRFECDCYPDCDGTPGLSIADFACFQTQFVQGHPYADCSSDGALTIADFACFQSKFVAGCP